MKKVLQPLALLLTLACLSLGRSRADAPKGKTPEKKATYDPTSQYVKKRIENWDVLVNKRLLHKDQEKLCGQALKLLGNHLFRISRVVPSKALAKLRKIPIWVELAHPRHPCMCYHVSAGWLRDHDMNPEKAGAVEIANAKNFLSWTLHQPWMVLHELAHGYHHQVLGFGHAGVRECYRRAVASKSYESVLHINGRKERAYALTNDKEYFAESSEAYFGTNDFYPFVRAELKQHDPKMFALLEKVWGVRNQ
jgi:hypothetical protein